MGREIQRAYGQESQCIVTVPLLEGTDGIAKMSKSYGNYVGIDEPPDTMFGKLMSISDELMLKYYELLSDITLEALNSLKEGIRTGAVHPKEAKVNLAKEIIARFHAADAARTAHENFEKMFRDKEIPDDIETVTIARPKSPLSLPHFLRDIGAVPSTAEGKRMVQQGGVSYAVDGKFVKIAGESIPGIDTAAEVVLKIGKRNFRKVIISSFSALSLRLKRTW